MYKFVKTGFLIDGTGSEPVKNACILLKNNIIEKIGFEKEFKDYLNNNNNNIEVINLTNFYVLPGLIDSHTHLSIVPGEGNQLAQMCLPATKSILRSIPNIYKSLKSGVTTMRIMGEEHYIDVELKEAIEKGLIVGPRLLISGKGLAASNGHGVANTTADGEEEIRKLVRQNLSHGVDLIKIFITGGISSEKNSLDFCSYTPQEVSVAVEEAKRAGKYVAAHAHGGKGLDLCIEKGVRTLEHVAFINKEQLTKVIENDLWLVGTFSILFHPEGIEKTDFNVPSIKEKVLQAREAVVENFRQIIKSGANLTVGTDAMHGFISYELDCLQKFGAGNMNAILAATRNAARACQVEDKLGTLEAGKLADFIAIRGNPISDIKNLRSVEHIFKDGKEIKNFT